MINQQDGDVRPLVPAPGVVFVEMAMEAARQHLGPEAQLRDVQMVWPFVVPKVWPWVMGMGMVMSCYF